MVMTSFSSRKCMWEQSLNGHTISEIIDSLPVAMAHLHKEQWDVITPLHPNINDSF